MSECPSGFLGQLPAGTPASCLAHLVPSGPVTKPSSRLHTKAPAYSVLRGTEGYGVHGSPCEEGTMSADAWQVPPPGTALLSPAFAACLPPLNAESQCGGQPEPRAPAPPHPAQAFRAAESSHPAGPGLHLRCGVLELWSPANQFASPNLGRMRLATPQLLRSLGRLQQSIPAKVMPEDSAVPSKVASSWTGLTHLTSNSSSLSAR